MAQQLPPIGGKRGRAFGPVIGMFMETGTHDNQEQQMVISPRLRTRKLSAKKRRKLFRIKGKKIKQK